MLQPPPPIVDRSVHTTAESPVTVTVNLGAIRDNAQLLQAKAEGADLMAVIKADAYGHGAIPVARTLADEGVRHFGVARLSEGVELRDHGIDGRILVLGPPVPDEISAYVEHELDLTVSSRAVAAKVARRARTETPLRVHVKVDTGMGRIGLAPDDAPAVLASLADAPGVILAGLWTHFATADEPDSALAESQLRRFEDVVANLDIGVERIHAANTGALVTLQPHVLSRKRSLVRTGIGLYGLAPSPQLDNSLDLRPAMRLSTRVTHVKTVSRGTPISYGARWRASERTRIATLGAGYGDGYPRLCSGRASVEVRGTLRPVVGTVCMDMCMVDLGPPEQFPARAVEVGDEATLFGPSSPTAQDIARWAETIPYEICCGVPPRVPRRYVDTEEELSSGFPTTGASVREH